MNTGNWSTGNRSTGHWSTGHWSTGNRSTGHRSTGCWSISNYSTGHFSTNDYDGFSVFNKPCSIDDWDNADKPDFLYFDLTQWIDAANMTDKEKADHPSHETTGGYLKVYEYQEAFKASYARASEEDKAKLFKLPNFDAEIFKEISGIDVNEKATINIGGKNYRVSDIEQALNVIEPV